MAIALIVRLKPNPGMAAEFEKAFAVQAAGVRENEPGCSLYQLVKSNDDPEAYAVMEIYDDEAAFKAHRNAPHIVANRETMSKLIAPGTKAEFFTLV